MNRNSFEQISYQYIGVNFDSSYTCFNGDLDHSSTLKKATLISIPNLTSPNIVHPTCDGYTVSRSLAREHAASDIHGFILDQSSGLNKVAYHGFERKYEGKRSRQTQRWRKLLSSKAANLMVNNSASAVQGDSLSLVFPDDSEKLKKAIRKGIAPSIRAQAWFHYSGAQKEMLAAPKHFYSNLIGESQISLARLITSQIDGDLENTFANNKIFADMEVMGFRGIDHICKSQDALRRILMATAFELYAVGYVEGMNNIAATLLLVTENEEQSFWIMRQIINKILPSDFYTDVNMGCNADQDVLSALIKEKLPKVHRCVSSIDISLHLLTASWFSNLFVNILPFEGVLRVWDCFLKEGTKVLFRIALALFKINQSTLLTLEEPFDIARCIRQMPRKQLDCGHLMSVAFYGLGTIRSEWLDEQRRLALPHWRAHHSVRRFSSVVPYHHQKASTEDSLESIDDDFSKSDDDVIFRIS